MNFRVLKLLGSNCYQYATFTPIGEMTMNEITTEKEALGGGQEEQPGA